MAAVGLSGKTIKNVSSVIHKAYAVAMRQGIADSNPCDAAELPKVTRPEIAPLTCEEILRFLKEIDGSPMRNAYALCLFAGLREGECLGLSWKQVDIEKGRITVSRQLQKEKKKGGQYYIAPTPKNGRSRTIELPAIAAGADVKSVQAMLGHSAASFTLNVYAHMSEEMMRDTAVRIQNYYDSKVRNGLYSGDADKGSVAEPGNIWEQLARLVESKATTVEEAAALIRQFGTLIRQFGQEQK